MREINTYEFATSFCEMAEDLMKQYKFIGNWEWGDPAGLSEGIPTYELVTTNNQKVWCTIIEYCQSGTQEPNRKGILATFPVDRKQSLGSVMATLVPYEYSKLFNTRAYVENEKYEIRNYGKVSVGRSSKKRDVFFDYMSNYYPHFVFLDEEDKPYIKCYEYTGKITKEEFAKQTFELTRLLDEFKNLYR